MAMDQSDSLVSCTYNLFKGRAFPPTGSPSITPSISIIIDWLNIYQTQIVVKMGVIMRYPISYPDIHV